MDRETSNAWRLTVSIMLSVLAVGCLCLIHALGWDRHIELASLDWRLTRFRQLEPSDDLLHVDIDDGSLEKIGRWPWPRETLAGLIDELDLAGAQAVVLDIELLEPQPQRYVSEAMSLYDTPGEIVSDLPPQPVFDDYLLARTIAGSRTEIGLAMHLAYSKITFGDLQWCAQNIVSGPGRDSLGEILENLPDSPGLAEAVTRAYLLHQSRRQLKKFAMSHEVLPRVSYPQGRAVPPLAPFLKRADFVGFVNVEPDSDGVVRRVKLLADADGQVFSQLGAATARRMIEVDRFGILRWRADENNVWLQSDGETVLRIPVDEEGRMLIRWADPQDQIYRIPASAVLYVFHARQRIERNRRLARLTQLEMAKLLNHQPLLELFALADDIYVRRVRMQRDRYRSMLFSYDPDDSAATLSSELRERLAEKVDLELPDPLPVAEAEMFIEAAIDRATDALRNRLDEFYLAEVPEAPRAREAYDRLVELRDRLAEIDAANASLLDDVARERNNLRERIEGKVCLVGMTATAGGDFVRTPVDPQLAGVNVHANVIGTILGRQYLREAPPWADYLAIVLLGLAVGLLAAAVPVLWALAGTILLLGGYGALNAAAIFGQAGVVLSMVAPLSAGGLVFVAVTAWRQLTEQRARRRIRAMFAHALSEPLVDRLLSNPKMARLGGDSREITCLFSDIAGFTPLSESLGPQRSVTLLNRYFDRVTDAVQTRGGGYINKFLGDGVFAMFGAPVEQADHARRALLAALAYRDELESLNAELTAETTEATRLRVRIGIATGEAMVGNCGSSNRMDYTAIGDVVNLSARLEEANKFFGTGILVGGCTWQAARTEDLLALPLGIARVTGQQRPVRLWSLLARRGEAEEAPIRAAERFAEAMADFEAGRFREAMEGFGEIDEHLPCRRPAEIFAAICAECLTNPPAPGWQPVCPLGDESVRVIVPGAE